MSRRTKVTHRWSMKVTATRASIERRGKPPYEYLDGLVQTPYGYVEVYSQGFESTSQSASTYRFVWKGRLYSQTDNQLRTPRGLTIMAGRFAVDVVKGRSS